MSETRHAHGPSGSVQSAFEPGPFVKAREERVLAKRSRYLHTNVREVHEMYTTTVAVRMHIGIYTVCELRDNTVAMGLRFCLHEVVMKNRDQFATFF